MPRLSGEQAHLWRDIRAGIRAVDGLFRRLAQRVRALIDRYAGTSLTHAVRRDILRQLDAILAPVFGLTRAAAQTAELTGLIVRMAANSSEGVWRRAYDRLARIVERRDPRFWQRIKLVSLTQREPTGLASVIAMFEGPATTAHRLRVERFFDASRSWVDGQTRPLSSRVWQQGQQVRRTIDQTIREAIRKGESPYTLGGRLEDYLNPERNVTVYRADGTIVTRPNRIYQSGYANNGARRLARTELSHAFNQATADAAKTIPGVRGLKYALSNAHPRSDTCNPLADRDLYGMGAGVYPVDECPIPPAHPNCLCHVRAVHVSRDDLIDQLVQQYGGAA